MSENLFCEWYVENRIKKKKDNIEELREHGKGCPRCRLHMDIIEGMVRRVLERLAREAGKGGEGVGESI